MNEIQRQEYLSALGVDTYIPRWVLPNAPASVACEWPVEALDTAIGAETVVGHELGNVAGQVRATALPSTDGSSSASAPGAADLLGQLGGEPAAVAVKSKPKADSESLADPLVANQPARTPPAAVPASTPTSEVPRFSLNLWRVSDDLLVVDSRQVELALPTDRLFHNMIFALGYRLAGPLQAEVLRWPLVEHSLEPQGELQARDMLHAYLDAQSLRQPFKHLLLMGEAAAKYILPLETELSLHKADKLSLPELSTADNPVTAIATHSLTALLQQPLLKVDSWRALQPLRLVAE